jgi:hypothetical protein
MALSNSGLMMSVPDVSMPHIRRVVTQRNKFRRPKLRTYVCRFRHAVPCIQRKTSGTSVRMTTFQFMRDPFKAKVFGFLRETLYGSVTVMMICPGSTLYRRPYFAGEEASSLMAKLRVT